MTSCERLHDFVACELSEAEAEAFRHHLAGCERCPDQLHELLQLAALEEMAGDGEPAEAPVIPLEARRERRRLVAASVVTAVVAAAAVALWWRGGESEPESIALVRGDSRPLEMRLSAPETDRWRPYEVQRSDQRPTEGIALRTLAALEQRGDFAALAVGHLLEREVERAEAALDKLDESAASVGDRAVAAHLAGDDERALRLIERSLELEPARAQALWNQAIVYRDLGLPLAAAALFDRVAARGEPGWSREAARRAEALRAPVIRARDAYVESYQQAAAAIAAQEPLPATVVERFPGLGRLLFYDALRSAPTREAAARLAAHARALDVHYGGDTLTTTLERVLAADWELRAPLAATYARLFAREELEPPQLEQFFDRARAAGARDILIGAMLLARGYVPAKWLGEYREQIAETGDIWLELLASEQRAAALERQGRPLEAIPILDAALERCEAASIAYRCGSIGSRLIRARMQRRSVASLAEARAKALRWLRIAEDHYGLVRFHLNLGEAAAYADELTGRTTGALARAHFGEALARDPQSCATAARAYQLLSGISVHRGQQRRAERESARAEEARAACELPLEPAAAYTRGEVLQGSGDAGAIKQFREQIAAARVALTSGTDRAALDLAEARALLEIDPGAARERLNRAIAAIGGRPTSAAERAVRGYSYAILAIEASRRGAHDQVLGQLAAELGRPAPERCAVALAWENGLAIAVRGASGGVAGELAADHSTRVDALPARLVSGLEGCEVVDVLARPPIYGQPNILPATTAWRYVTAAQRSPERESATTRHRLVVADVPAPPELELPPLLPWRDDGEADLVLRGPRATPRRVLEAMRAATEIEIHAHGLVSGARAEPASIVLAPSSDGHFTLTAGEIANQPLDEAGLVILGACSAGAGAAYFDAPWSLPVSFLEAGAQTVIASPNPIPDSASQTFFAQVRAAVAGGVSPAVAVRDARVRWQGRPGQRWANDVLVFE